MAKRANGEGSIKHRTDGRWEARYTFQGKSHSIYGKSQAEVRKKLTEVTSKIDGGTFAAPSKTTVAEWLEEWQEKYLRSVKESTRQRYEIDVRIHLVPAIGGVRLCKLSGDMITEMYSAEQNKGLSVKSIKNLHGTLHKALEQAAKKKLITGNPCEDAIIPESDEAVKEMHPLRDEQVKQFRQMAAGNFFEFLFDVALFTGMRQGEIIGLTWDCVDFERGDIHLYRQLKRIPKSGGQFRFTTLKNKQDRRIKPPQHVMEVLRKVKRQQAEWRLRCGECWHDTGLVFTNEIGEHVNDRTLYNNFKKIVDEMHLPEVLFHDLRHTYATLALQNGVDPKTVSATLGHATVAFTMDKYGHVSQAMLTDSANKMQNYISGL